LASVNFDVIEVCSGTSAEIIKKSLIEEYKIPENKISTVFVEQSDAARENAMFMMSETVYKNGVAGNVAELGVYRGKFAKEINRYFSDRRLYLFDTFEGFPERDVNFDDEKGFSHHKASYLKVTAPEDVMGVMPNPERCVIKKGYFPESLQGLEDIFCFVSLDPDLYKPILEGLRYFYPRLEKGGFIMVHDYFNPFFSGVAGAVKDFEAETGLTLPKIPIGDLMSIAITK